MSNFKSIPVGMQESMVFQGLLESFQALKDLLIGWKKIFVYDVLLIDIYHTHPLLVLFLPVFRDAQIDAQIVAKPIGGQLSRATTDPDS